MSKSDNDSRRSLLWRVTIGALRDFVWADLDDGLLRLHGLSRPVQWIIGVGFVMVLYLLGSIIFNDQMRGQSNLISLSYTKATLGRGGLVPETAVPLTLFSLTVAWSFLLAGSIRVTRWLKYLILYVYFFLFAQMFLTFIGAVSLGNFNLVRLAQLFLAIGGYLLVPLFIAYRSFRPPRPGFEFAAIFLFLGTSLGMVNLSAVAAWREFGSSLGFAGLELAMGSMVILVLAFVILIGVEIARFVRKAAVWSSEIVWYRLPPAALRIALGATMGLMLLRIVQNAVAHFQQRSTQAALFGIVGGATIFLSVWVLWWLVGRLSRDRALFCREDVLDETTDRYALWLILMLVGMAMINVLFLLAFPAFFIIGATGVTDAMNLFSNWVLTHSSNVIIAFGGAAVLLGLWLATRQRPFAGLYIAIVGATLFWYRVTDPGRPLEIVGWQGSISVDVWWAFLLLGITALWLLRRKLSRLRLLNLLILSLILLLLQQTDFIEDPFSPFLSFAGVGFLAFGILWDALTIGAWANRDTPRLPRLSRIYLYLGYVLLSVATINWAFSQHNLFMLEQFTGGGALLGLDAIGRPMLYILFPMLLRQPAEAGTIFLHDKEISVS